MLSEFQKQKLRILFAVHDLKGDGVLTRADFDEYTKRIASTRGWTPNSAKAKELLDNFMVFWNGLEEYARVKGARQVTVPEWIGYWDGILANQQLYDRVVPPIGRAIFTVLDANGDGAVTVEEYAATLKYGGHDEADAAAAFARLDLDHDGLLSIDEVVALGAQFFRSNDPADPGNALFGILPQLQAAR